MAFPRMDDGIATGPHGAQHAADRPDRRAGQRQVVAHLVNVAADPAEVGLHVDDDQGRVVGPQVAVVGPGIGVGSDGAADLRCRAHSAASCCSVSPKRRVGAAKPQDVPSTTLTSSSQGNR